MSAQVDMFSYGMVLYELLSGQRPALGHHQLQIAKKLSKGIRPLLGQPEEVQFHRLQALMTECWDTRPEKVPWRAEGLARTQAAAHPHRRRVANAQGEPSPPASSRKRRPGSWYIRVIFFGVCIALRKTGCVVLPSLGVGSSCTVNPPFLPRQCLFAEKWLEGSLMEGSCHIIYFLFLFF